jgi:excisionase family DNA binding protein
MDDHSPQATDTDPANHHRIARARAALVKARATPRPKPPQRSEVEPLALRVRETAQALNIGVSTVKGLIASGQLRSVKLGGTRLVAVAEIQRFLKAHQT